MTKIEKLTPEQEALIPIVRDEWIKVALATGPVDREAAQVAISDAYRVAGLEPPRHWIWLGSPWAGWTNAWMLCNPPDANDEVGDRWWDRVRGQVGAPVWDEVVVQTRYEVGLGPVGRQVYEQVWAQVTDKVHDADWLVWGGVRYRVREQVRDQARCQAESQVTYQVDAEVWRQLDSPVPGARYYWRDVSALASRDFMGKIQWDSHDVSRLAYFDFFRRIKRGEEAERLEPLMRLAAVAGWWWWPFQGTCIISERPTILHRDAAGDLHCDTGPAIAFPDNWAIHAWHGMQIPAWFIEERHRLTPDSIDAEANAELRRVMLEIFGFDRYIEARGARLVAEDECLGLPRQLFEIDLAGERFRVLRVVNGTLEADGRRRQFHLGVPLECNTPHEAVAWSYGRPPAKYREGLRS
jgi:hypothetical protein